MGEISENLKIGSEWGVYHPEKSNAGPAFFFSDIDTAPPKRVPELLPRGARWSLCHSYTSVTVLIRFLVHTSESWKGERDAAGHPRKGQCDVLDVQTFTALLGGRVFSPPECA